MARIDALSPAERERAQDVRAVATVRRTSNRAYALALSVQTGRHRAERTLEAVACSSLANAAAWFIAMALDPSRDAAAEAAPVSVAEDAETNGTETNATETNATEIAPTPAQTGEPLASETPPPAPRGNTSITALKAESWARWWRAAAFGGVWSAGLPAAQAGAGVRAGFGAGIVYVELEAMWAFARTRSLADDVRARFRSQQLAFSTCAQWGQRWRAGPCATLSLLRSEGNAQNAERPTGRVLLWGSAGLSLLLGWRLGRWFELMADVGAELPITARPEFSIDELGRAARAAPVAVFARLGLGGRFSIGTRGRAP